MLIRGHGLTLLTPTIQDCVRRAVYIQTNATIQTTALLIHAACFAAEANKADGLKFLSEKEAAAALETTARAWDRWLQEVEAARLYINRG